MAICSACNREVTEVDDCTENHVVEFMDRLAMEGVPYGATLTDNSLKCPICGVFFGNFHHPGCDMEICPRCRKSVVESCSCQPVTIGT